AVQMVKATTLTIVAIIFIQFFYLIIPGSRMVVLYFWLILSVLLIAARIIIIRVETYLYSKGVGARRSIVIGSSHLSQDIAERMILYPGLGYFYEGTLDDGPPDKIYFHLKNRFKLLGSVDSYKQICIDQNIDALFLVKRDISNFQYRELSFFCLSNNIELNVLTEPILSSPFNQFRTFDGIPVVSTIDLRSQLFERFLKRLFDVLASLVVLIFFSPVFLLTIVWIRLVSPNGPIFYLQERMGYLNQPFKMIKFRSMVPNAEQGSGPVMVDESGDMRYIKGGKFIRQFSIDELPQFWNVLVGQMSIVGPRPERPFFINEFSKTIPLFNKRHVVPVGITGWAQINGRSVLTRRPEHKIKYDFYYINHWSFLFDIKICIKTLFVVFAREESY
ncbi:MAG: sugar transferase, partial [Candidatus Margulisiibacteriota bacterium]